MGGQGNRPVAAESVSRGQGMRPGNRGMGAEGRGLDVGGGNGRGVKVVVEEAKELSEDLFWEGDGRERSLDL